MKALVIEPFPTTKGIIPAGQIIEISPALLEKLKGKVETISSPQAPGAWLTGTILTNFGNCGRSAPPSWNMTAACPGMMRNTRRRNVCTCWRSWLSALTRGAETEGAS